MTTVSGNVPISFGRRVFSHRRTNLWSRADACLWSIPLPLVQLAALPGSLEIASSALTAWRLKTWRLKLLSPMLRWGELQNATARMRYG